MKKEIEMIKKDNNDKFLSIGRELIKMREMIRKVNDEMKNNENNQTVKLTEELSTFQKKRKFQDKIKKLNDTGILKILFFYLLINNCDLYHFN